MLSDRHKAQDLAQDVFLQLHRSLAAIESDAHLSSLVAQVTINRAIDRIGASRSMKQSRWKRT